MRPESLTGERPGPADGAERQVLEDLAVVVFRTDPPGNWTYLNPAWTKITGFSVEETLGTNFLDYVHPDERDATVALFMAVIEGAAAACHHETRYRTRSGAYRWMELRANLLFDEAGALIGNSGTLVDITARKEASQTTQERAQLAELVAGQESFDDLPLGGLLLDADLVVLGASPTTRRLLGYSLEPGDRFADLLPKFDIRDTRGEPLSPQWGPLATAVRTGQRQFAELLWRPLDGAPQLSIQTTVIPEVTQGDRVGELVVLLQDVTELRGAEIRQASVARLGQRALEATSLHELFDETVSVVVRVLETDHAQLFVTGPDGELRSRAQAGSLTVTGDPSGPSWSTQAVLAEEALRTQSPVLTAQAPADVEGAEESSSLSVPVGGAHGPLAVIQTQSKAHRVYRSEEISFLRSLATVVVAAAARREVEEAAVQQSLHDPLTGLANRRLLRDRLSKALQASRRDRRGVALLLADLDGFKDINDSLGHDVGDEVLRVVASRLESSIRQVDTVARLGGDEFVVLLPGLSTVDDAAKVARKLRDRIAEPVQVVGLSLDVKASVGVIVSPTHGDEASVLLRRADVAMYQAKATAAGYCVYSADHDELRMGRLSLLQDLHRALQGGDELFLHYQPKVDLVTGTLTGVEALVRWQHPKQGLLSPDEFVPLAERNGLADPLTFAVLSSALRQARRWLDKAVALPIAVNVSPQMLRHPRLCAVIQGLLEKGDVPAELLRLEVTESGVMQDPQASAEVIASLQDIGVVLAVDDFGTGYSSLEFLRHVPVQELKIDRSFITDMVVDSREASIVQSVIELAHTLEMRVVAEGIETASACQQLIDFGCDEGQGYYLGRPVAADELTVLGSS